MPILSWVQNKLRHGNSKPFSKPMAEKSERECEREEFSDWPSALLAIGTFGLKKMNDDHVDKGCSQLESTPQDESAASTNDTKEEEICVMQTKDQTAAITKKSASFLLKKVFVCAGGFKIPDPTLTDHSLLPSESTMEKILRKILHKKIHPQGSYPAARAAKRYLTTEPDHHRRHIDEEEASEKPIQETKWVNTDTDYIVLEI